MKYTFALLHKPTSSLRLWGHKWHLDYLRKIANRSSDYVIISLDSKQAIK